MIFYKDNPNLGIKTVTTVNGVIEYRRNCKHIREQYYIINQDCFQVNGKFYRKNGGLIEFDHENNQWVLIKNSSLLQGIIGFENKKPIIGYFSKNDYNNVSVSRYDYAINSDILKQNGFFEDIGTGIWHNRSEHSEATYRNSQKIRNERNYQNKGYNIEDNKEEFQMKIEAFKAYNFPISKNVNRFAKFLDNRTFGIELELSEGFIPDNLQYRTGIVMCRDGSISGGEAVTVPMSGAKGVQNIVNICEILSKRTNIDINCSYHIHLGNIPKNRNYLCALYILGYYIQEELFTMFPYYKTNPQGIKKKNYCQKLKKMNIHPLKEISKQGYDEYLEDTYTKIFTFLSDGTPPNEMSNRKNLRHPIAQKWNRPSRYYHLNLQNMLFSERGTAEFRLHQGSLNPYKLINWLYICNAITQFAEANEREIFTNPRKITLENVLNYYKDANPDNKDAELLSKYLLAYYKERTEVYYKDFVKQDFVSEKDALQDKDYKFVFEDLESLF